VRRVPSAVEGGNSLPAVAIIVRNSIENEFALILELAVPKLLERTSLYY
jgi:hypothetical protein